MYKELTMSSLFIKEVPILHNEPPLMNLLFKVLMEQYRVDLEVNQISHSISYDEEYTKISDHRNEELTVSEIHRLSIVNKKLATFCK
jgi:hypothetical protein